MDELNRQVRVINMMRSIHAILYERYKKLALILDIILIVFSIFLNIFIFINPSILAFIGFSDMFGEVIIGISSIVIFSISIILFRVNLKGKSRAHEDAVKALTRLKVECNTILASDTSTQDIVANQIQKYSDIVTYLPSIPDTKFNKLKRKHEMKVLLSKTISRYPGIPIWKIKYLLFRKHSKAFRKELIDELLN